MAAWYSINSWDNPFKRSDPDHNWQSMGSLYWVWSLLGREVNNSYFGFIIQSVVGPTYTSLSCSVVFLQTRREKGVKPVRCTYLSARLASAVFSTCIRLSVCPSVCARSEGHVQGVAATRPFLDASTKHRLLFHVARTVAICR